MEKEKQYLLTASKHQFELALDCVEDIHQLIVGDKMLINSCKYLTNPQKANQAIVDLKRYIYSDSSMEVPYNDFGNNCPNPRLSKYIKETFIIYLYLKSFLIQNKDNNEDKMLTIKITEPQVLSIVKCVEDCARFVAGQLYFTNLSFILTNYPQFYNAFENIKKITHPELKQNESYGWSGGGCRYEPQKKFISESYYFYNEIFYLLKTEDSNSVKILGSSTLRCDLSGPEISLTKIK